jgi:hypothetical protein
MERLIADIVRRVDRRCCESRVLALQHLGRFADGLDEFATLHLADPLPPWSGVGSGRTARLLRAPGRRQARTTSRRVIDHVIADLISVEPRR